jgi:Protein of unknown function (DUF2934)
MPKRTTTSADSAAPARKRTVVRRRKRLEVTHEMIATRAYYLHLEAGGDPFENWLRAERELVPA